MPLRLIARDLYRLQQQVTRYEKELASCAPRDSDALKLKLHRARKDRDQVRRILDGHLDR